MKKIPKISTKLKPKYFELPFGSKNNKPIAISKIFLNGKIDRIDKEENNIYLIDYKRKDNGETKQLILYSLALEKMFPEMNLIGGVFKPIKTSKNYFKNFIVFEDENDKFFKFKNKEITKKEIIKRVSFSNTAYWQVSNFSSTWRRWLIVTMEEKDLQLPLSDLPIL